MCNLLTLWNRKISKIGARRYNLSVRLKREIQELLVEIITAVKAKYSKPGIFVIGDFNNWKYDAFCKSSKLNQIVTFPTFYNSSNNSSSFLDLCFTNLDEYYNSPCSLPPLVKTLKNRVHSCISIHSLNSVNWSKRRNLIQCRPRIESIEQQFVDEIEGFDTVNLLSESKFNCLEENVEKLSNCLLSTFNSVSVPFNKLVSESDPLWLTPEIKKLL